MSSTFIIFLVIPLAHFVADFLLQTEWMANNKSKEFWPLYTHVIVYTLTIMVFMGILIDNLPMVYCWAIINGIAHFITDFCTSRAMRTAREANKIGLFFKILGLDQLIHAWCLFGSFIAFF